VDGRLGTVANAHFADLPKLLSPGDLLVVNDAATLPASFRVRLHGALLELRLAAALDEAGAFEAVLLGAGDWRTRTEDRPPPPTVRVGDRLELDSLSARVEGSDGRRLRIRFDAQGDALWPQLFRLGKPVQYAHLSAPLDPWDVQTLWASRPWSMELPSASFPFTLELFQTLRARGISCVSLTHGCGLSSTGDPQLDRQLPWPERYEIPASTVEALRVARGRRNRVIAVGTSVTRALESAATDEGVQAGRGLATLRLGPDHSLRVVDGVISGLHEPSESHFDLLLAFVPRALLERAWKHAQGAGYLGHEYGDLCLVLRCGPEG
jgi:S-adenosylmethionine:tRNA ribosyltransferase-isomerase